MIKEYVPQMITAIGALIALTNLTVEVVKKIIPDEKFPTNLLAVILALIFTLMGFFAFASMKEIAIKWYYVVAAIVVGILVSYGAMFGYDKLKEVIDGLKK